MREKKRGRTFNKGSGKSLGGKGCQRIGRVTKAFPRGAGGVELQTRGDTERKIGGGHQKKNLYFY